MNKEEYKTFEELKEELGDKFEEYMYKSNIELLKQNKKYKEVIDKANKYINKMFDTGFYNDDYYLGHLKMILEDKEVE